LLSLGQFHAAQSNDVALARSLLDEAAPLVAQLGNRQLVGDLAYGEALLELSAGRLPAASAAIQRAYDAMVDVFGEDRPELGPIVAVRAQIAAVAGEAAIAARDHTRVVELYGATYGPEHPETLNARLNLATHDLYSQDIERGKAELVALIAALEHGAPSVLAEAHTALCESLYVAGDPDAVAACTRAVTAAERGFGPTHPRLGVALFDLGQAVLNTDDDARLPEAIQILRRSEQLVRPMGDDQLALTRFMLARALVAADQAPAEARSLLELAIPVLRRNTSRGQLVELVPQWYPAWRSLAAFAKASAPTSRGRQPARGP
ncbi:MAG TPA: tetratricopeptide repeat protein, partial [Kofleriaceae bacterium]|nr:tetratricopeptide repeat protein [Kofleriaceae bacterium]